MNWSLRVGIWLLIPLLNLFLDIFLYFISLSIVHHLDSFGNFANRCSALSLVLIHNLPDNLRISDLGSIVIEDKLFGTIINSEVFLQFFYIKLPSNLIQIFTILPITNSIRIFLIFNRILNHQ